MKRGGIFQKPWTAADQKGAAAPSECVKVAQQ